MKRVKIINLHGTQELTVEKALNAEMQLGEVAVKNGSIKGESELYVLTDNGKTQSIDTFITKDAVEKNISSKQDIISDIETIRQGAAKGATALQSYTEQYKGTVTGVKINGSTKNPSNGVVDLGTVITSHQDISSKQDKLVSGTNIKTINGTSILGSGDIIIEGGNGTDLSDYATKEELNSKQDAITDLEVIRQGAAKGATALQSIPSEYVTETELSNKGYATISALNNKVDTINGKQLSTEDFTTALKTKLEGLNNYDDTELSNAIETLRGDFDNIVSGDTTTAIKTFNEVIAFLDGITDTQDLDSIIASIEQQIAGKADNYSVVHIDGAETITGVKTFNGRVNFLGSGDSNAMYLSTNTRLNVNGTTNTVLGFSSGTFLINNAAYNLTLRGKGTRPTYNSTTLALFSDIPDAVTENTVSGWGFTKNAGTYSKPSGGIPKSDLASSVQTSLGKADTALQSHQDISGKQDKLVSGTNIKTINGTSILGSGDIIIESGSSNANVQAVDTGDVIDDVTVIYVTKTYVDELVGDINSVLESIISGGNGESKPINYGRIQNIGNNTYALQFDLPVTSTLEINCGNASYTVLTGNTRDKSYPLGPGESIGNTATVSPDEDETYIYKIIIE